MVSKSHNYSYLGREGKALTDRHATHFID